MMQRRDILAGLACLGAMGTAEWLRPRHQLVLMRAGTSLKQIVPLNFGSWRGGESGDIVIPRTEGSLAARLYSDELGRLYRNVDSDANIGDVMLLAAYGKSQSDSLQLHRPEVCYPANGFAITYRKFVDIRIGQFTIPAVALTAVAGSRIEDIVYWTRLGEALPRTAGEQRTDRLEAAMAGYVGDGVLMRASMVRSDPTNQGFDMLSDFMAQLVAAVAQRDRPALIGKDLSIA